MNLNTNFLLLSTSGAIISVILTAVIAIVIGGLIGYLVRKISVDKKVGKTEQVVSKMLEDAQTECRTIKKEAVLEAKEQDLKLRNEFERDTKEKKIEIQRMEQRLLQREENLDKKEESLQKKTENLERQQLALQGKEKDVEILQDKISKQHEIMVSELEKVSQMTKEQAKDELIETIKDDARREAAKLVRNIEQEAKDEADVKAKKIISLAIQKCSTDHASEITVSTVPLPNDDMKGRIIGREGRNIRAIENATGIDLIIDDTPEIVLVSGFDPVRREVARITLEKLIMDGRIHPARIEETVEKVKKELDVQMKEAGENAMFEAGLFGLHPEIIKLLGRLKFRTSYGQNV